MFVRTETWSLPDILTILIRTYSPSSPSLDSVLNPNSPLVITESNGLALLSVLQQIPDRIKHSKLSSSRQNVLNTTSELVMPHIIGLITQVGNLPNNNLETSHQGQNMSLLKMSQLQCFGAWVNAELIPIKVTLVALMITLITLINILFVWWLIYIYIYRCYCNAHYFMKCFKIWLIWPCYRTVALALNRPYPHPQPQIHSLNFHSPAKTHPLSLQEFSLRFSHS